MRNAILTTSVLVAIGACGGSEGPKPAPSTLDSNGAQASVRSAHDVVAAMSDADGSSAANAVIALTAAGQAIVLSPGATARSLPAMPRLPERWPQGTRQDLTGSAVCTVTLCTFTDFGDDTPNGSYRINGSISRSGDRLTFDLSYEIIYGDFAMTWTFDGDLTITDVLIDGALHSHADSTLDASNTLSFDLDFDYDAIGFDSAACPTSGTLTANVNATVSGPNGSAAYAAYGSVTFGPACGQVTLH